MFSRYKSAELAVLGTTFFTEGGDWRSIYMYVRKAEAEGRRVVVVNPRGKRGLRQTLAAWAFAPRVIVNGLNAFESLLVLAMCWQRENVQIYLHETEHALDNCKLVWPLRFRVISQILGRNPVLCVSQKAAELYRERFGTKRTHVIYECPGDSSDVKLDPKRLHIVNVGSLNQRKGVELFSKVADLAKERHPNWQFHWVGGVATMNKLYLSPSVKWHGFMWHPNDLVAQCRLFFLSSVDDPCPLSALEALQSGIGCVAFRNTGTAEIIAGLKGCEVYGQHTPESAIAALESALNQRVDVEDQKRAMKRLVGLDQFSRAIDQSLGF